MKLQKLTALTSAAVLLAGSAPANTTVQNLFSGAVLTAHAESTAAGSISLSEDGVLTLSGELTRDQIWAYGENKSVTAIVAAPGTVLPANCSSLFQNGFDSEEDNTITYMWKNVTSIDLSNADTSKVTSTTAMFAALYASLDEDSIEYSSYRSINLSGTDFSSVSNSDQMFYGCYNLTSLILPSGITKYSSWMFGFCSSLTSITIPDGVTSIGRSAFSECSNLTNITIPDSATDISRGSFSGTAWLDARREENPLVIVNNIVIDGLTCSGDITIPDGVTSIGELAFGYCKNLTSIIIPDSVASIGKCAFYECSNLTNITIPNSVTSIGDLAFGYCSNLTSFYLKGKNPPEINNYTFYETPDYMKMYVPAEAVETYKKAANWSRYANRIIGYSNNQLANGEYKQTAQKNGTYYTRFVFVVPKSEIKGKSKVVYTATYNETDYTFNDNCYYTGVISNGVTYTPASDGSVMFVVTVKSGSNISKDLKCKVEFE